MQTPRYALVAYVKSPAGEFVENLRRELHPGLPQVAAHLTILPPRPLAGSESEALELLQRVCGGGEAVFIRLRGVDAFFTATPTPFFLIECGPPRTVFAVPYV